MRDPRLDTWSRDKDSGSTSEINGDCLQGLHISVKIIAEGFGEIASVEIE